MNFYEVLHRLVSRHGWASEEEKASAVAAVEHVASGGRPDEDPAEVDAPVPAPGPEALPPEDQPPA